MKKIIILISALFFCVALNAQDRKITSSKVFTVKGATADTLNKDASNTFTIFVPTFATKFKVGVAVDSVDGYPKLQTILNYSLNYSDWIPLDTILTSEADEYEVGLLNEPYAQYLQIVTTAVDSTQTAGYKYDIVIEKGE